MIARRSLISLFRAVLGSPQVSDLTTGA